MNILFLRGKVDSRTQKVKNLSQHSDMWTHLAHAMCNDGDHALIAYWGGERSVKYNDRLTEVWVKDFKYHNFEFKPDLIFARGGFKEYHHVLRRYPSAKKVYYGAGVRYLPDKEYSDYDLVVVDLIDQAIKVRKKYPSIKVLEWMKPVAPHFKPYNVEKKYDICYIANGQQAKIKRIKWVYDTKPEHLSMLHLGYPSKYKLPSNTVQFRVDRMDMPKYISMCRAGIAPYTGYDSGARAISEMRACGLTVIIRRDTVDNISLCAYEDIYWKAVLHALKVPGEGRVTPEMAWEEIRGHLYET